MQQITTKDEFEHLIKDNNNVIIDFYATWCGPCKMLSPIINKIANEHSNVTFVSVDVDVADELADLFQITSIPTLAYIKNSRLALREVGFQPQEVIEENIKTIFE